MIVGLVACSSKKRATPSAAIDLFRRNFGQGIHIAVLSAKHGVVPAENILAPYDEALCSKSKEERADWARSTGQQLRSLFPDATFVVLAGRAYASALSGLPAEFPLAGLTIGRALAFLDKR